MTENLSCGARSLRSSSRPPPACSNTSTACAPRIRQPKVAFGEQHIRVYGDTAVNSGAYTFTVFPGGQPLQYPARYSFTYREGRAVVDRRPPLVGPSLAAATRPTSAPMSGCASQIEVQPGSPAAPTSRAEQTGSASFKCDGRTRCSQMTSCAEATYFLKNCPGTKMRQQRRHSVREAMVQLASGRTLPRELDWIRSLFCA